MNLHDLFAIARHRASHHVVIETRSPGLPGHRLSYEELFAQADRLAAGLQRWGLGKGDRVAFYVGSRPELVIAYLAVIRLGAIVVPMNLRYRRLEIGHILSDCRPRLLITERDYLPILEEVPPSQRTSLEATLLLEDFPGWSAPVDSLDAPAVEGDDLALIMYTSGTTGRSKGAMLSHNNVMATVTGLLSAWGWQAEDRLLLCLPLFHVHGLIVGLHCALAAGATILLHAHFDAAAVLDDLLHANPTLFFAVPTIYVRLLQEMERHPDPLDFSHMRLFCSGSAPLPPEVFVAFQDRTGHAILERYGMTETGMNLSNPYAGPRRPGTVGTPLPGVSIRIVDANLQDVAPGQEGELLVRGSNVFQGYWQDPEKTAASFCQDAQGREWFRTGDLARQDPDHGYVTLLGRRHELIISGGFNIYPREIEELLTTYPGLAEAAVVGEPHPEWGEVPVAYIVCTGEINEAELVAFCKGQLAGYKVPRRFYRVSTLPRNAMGKLQKHLLPRAD